MATQSVKDILDTKIPSPSFVFNPTSANPLPSNISGVNRSTQGQAFVNGRHKTISANEPRLNGDGLLVESSATSHMGEGNILGTYINDPRQITYSHSTNELGYPLTQVREEAVDDKHRGIFYNTSVPSDSYFSIQAVVRRVGREHVGFEFNTTSGGNRWAFSLDDETLVNSTANDELHTIDTAVEDYYGNFQKITVIGNLDSGTSGNWTAFKLYGPNVEGYYLGDSSKGADVLWMDVQSNPPTTPVLSGSREAENGLVISGPIKGTSPSGGWSVLFDVKMNKAIGDISHVLGTMNGNYLSIKNDRLQVWNSTDKGQLGTRDSNYREDNGEFKALYSFKDDENGTEYRTALNGNVGNKIINDSYYRTDVGLRLTSAIGSIDKSSTTHRKIIVFPQMLTEQQAQLITK
jgi:rRNA processing protein Gar1